MINCLYYIIFCTLLITSPCLGQLNIAGVVHSNNEPIEDAYIFLNEDLVDITDKSGHFSLQVDDTSENFNLRITHTGYVDYEIILSDSIILRNRIDSSTVFLKIDLVEHIEYIDQLEIKATKKRYARHNLRDFIISDNSIIQLIRGIKFNYLIRSDLNDIVASSEIDTLPFRAKELYESCLGGVYAMDSDQMIGIPIDHAENTTSIKSLDELFRPCLLSDDAGTIIKKIDYLGQRVQLINHNSGEYEVVYEFWNSDNYELAESEMRKIMSIYNAQGEYSVASIDFTKSVDLSDLMQLYLSDIAVPSSYTDSQPTQRIRMERLISYASGVVLQPIELYLFGVHNEKWVITERPDSLIRLDENFNVVSKTIIDNVRKNGFHKVIQDNKSDLVYFVYHYSDELEVYALGVDGHLNFIKKIGDLASPIVRIYDDAVYYHSKKYNYRLDGYIGHSYLLDRD